VKRTTANDLLKKGYKKPIPSLSCSPDFTAAPVWHNEPFEIISECPDVRVGVGFDSPNAQFHVRSWPDAYPLAMAATSNDGHLFTVNDDGNSYMKEGLAIDCETNTFGKLKICNMDRGTGLYIDNTMHPGDYTKVIYSEFTNPTTEFFKFQNTSTNQTAFFLNAEGRMYINNGTQTTLQLDPNGLLRARRIKVDADIWADFVFEPEYKLMPLSEVEMFVKKEKHLPNVPSETELKENGLDIQEMNKILMQKIEELTLYMIEQDKKINELNSKISDLEKK
jgi:hypothetical protein